MKDSVDVLAEIFLSRFCEKVAERLDNMKTDGNFVESDSSARGEIPHSNEGTLLGEELTDEQIEILAGKIVDELIQEGESYEELPPVAVEI